MTFFFFFSSRRRHTRLTCDWSSDVCSSDLDPSTRSPWSPGPGVCRPRSPRRRPRPAGPRRGCREDRSEEHTSELQSHVNLVCRLLLEKKKKTKINPPF